MAKVERARRSGAKVVTGRRRAQLVAERLGMGLREARLLSGTRQLDAAMAAGISQVRFGELERGLGARASLETWACAAAAVGEQLVGFLELAPGAAPPRDIEHLRRQAAVIAFAAAGGWQALPEFAVDQNSIRSRSIDVVLIRADRRQAVLVEIWNWFADVGDALRSLDGKREALTARLVRDRSGDGGGMQRASTVRCLFVVRRTRRNVRLVRDLRPLFAARFGASSRTWLRALTDSSAAPPEADGLLWSSSDGSLEASRL